MCRPKIHRRIARIGTIVSATPLQRHSQDFCVQGCASAQVFTPSPPPQLPIPIRLLPLSPLLTFQHWRCVRIGSIASPDMRVVTDIQQNARYLLPSETNQQENGYRFGRQFI